MLREPPAHLFRVCLELAGNRQRRCRGRACERRVKQMKRDAVFAILNTKALRKALERAFA